MKKFVSLLLVLCLVLGGVSAALAVGAPVVTKHPVSAQVDKNGRVEFSFTIAKNNYLQNKQGVSWRFINPETGAEFTGSELQEVMKDVKGFKVDVANGRSKVILKKVPESMHGWQVYAHVSNKSGYSVDTEKATIWVHDPDQPEPAAAPEPAAPAAQPAAGEITVFGENLLLLPLDAEGNPQEDRAASSLSLAVGSGVEVRFSAPVTGWVINGLEVILTTAVTSFQVKNLTADTAIQAVPAPAAAPAEETPAAEPPAEDPQPVGDGFLVTCTGCFFTYHAGGLRSVTSGTVPAGASIIVFADDPANGYSINGGAPERAGTSSFRLTVEGNTTITVQ